MSKVIYSPFLPITSAILNTSYPAGKLVFIGDGLGRPFNGQELDTEDLKKNPNKAAQYKLHTTSSGAHRGFYPFPAPQIVTDILAQFKQYGCAEITAGDGIPEAAIEQLNDAIFASLPARSDEQVAALNVILEQKRKDTDERLAKLKAPEVKKSTEDSFALIEKIITETTKAIQIAKGFAIVHCNEQNSLYDANKKKEFDSFDVRNFDFSGVTPRTITLNRIAEEQRDSASLIAELAKSNAEGQRIFAETLVAGLKDILAPKAVEVSR